jgi:hypothetical protein
MPLPRLPHGEPAPSPEDASVTVTVARKVAVGREADFEQWVQGIVEAAAKFPGFLGAGALRPPEACGLPLRRLGQAAGLGGVSRAGGVAGTGR